MTVKIIVTARALIFNKQNELLLVKNEKNGVWFTPGGWLDGFEKLEETCIREVYEETGLNIAVKKLFKIDYFQLTAEQNIKWKEDVNKIEHYFICEIISGNIKTNSQNQNLWEDEDKGNTGFIKFFSKLELKSHNIAPQWLNEVF